MINKQFDVKSNLRSAGFYYKINIIPNENYTIKYRCILIKGDTSFLYLIDSDRKLIIPRNHLIHYLDQTIDSITFTSNTSTINIGLLFWNADVQYRLLVHHFYLLNTTKINLLTNLPILHKGTQMSDIIYDEIIPKYIIPQHTISQNTTAHNIKNKLNLNKITTFILSEDDKGNHQQEDFITHNNDIFGIKNTLTYYFVYTGKHKITTNKIYLQSDNLLQAIINTFEPNNDNYFLITKNTNIINESVIDNLIHMNKSIYHGEYISDGLLINKKGIKELKANKYILDKEDINLLFYGLHKYIPQHLYTMYALIEF